METVFVTGASRGIGLEFTRQYAEAGNRVVATCRNPGAATELAGLSRRYPDRVRIEALDVADFGALDALRKRLGDVSIDILINNAGDIGPRDPDRTRLAEQYFGSLNFAEWRRVLDVNTLAPIAVAESFLEPVARSAGRRMVFVSSTTGSNAEGRYPLFAYCSSKAALNKCITMLADVLRPRGITCLAVCPGHVRTALGGQGALLGVEESVRGLRAVIQGAGLPDSGRFLRYNGEVVAW